MLLHYSAFFDKYGILAEATASTRTSVERYTFPAGQGNILVNLGIGLTNETGASIRRVSDTVITGSRLMGTFCYNPDAVFTMYFALRVNKRPSASGFWKNSLRCMVSRPSEHPITAPTRSTTTMDVKSQATT